MGKLALIVVLLLGGLTARAEPAWGGNCLACHGNWDATVVHVFGESGVVDPDESATGAPDRGPLKTFQVWRGDKTQFKVEVVGLLAGDTYAAEVKRLRYAGVEQGGALQYGADCEWPEWGETPQYYSRPAQAYRWGEGPAVLTYELTAAPAADNDYYDLIYAIAGAYANGTLFCGEEHFYLHVRGVTGDLDCSGAVTWADINPFVLALLNPTAYAAQFGGCSDRLADCDGDGTVGFADINPFVELVLGDRGAASGMSTRAPADTPRIGDPPEGETGKQEKGAAR